MDATSRKRRGVQGNRIQPPFPFFPSPGTPGEGQGRGLLFFAPRSHPQYDGYAIIKLHPHNPSRLYNKGWMHPPAKRFLKIAFLIAIAFATGGAATTTTAPDPDNDPAAFIASSRKALDPWQKLPLLPARPITDVVRFTEDQGLLVADWPMLRSGPVSGRIPITDLPGQAIIECHNTAKFPTALYPMFEYYDLTQPDFVCRHLQIINSSDHLEVVQDSQSIRRFQSVSLLENIGQNGDPPITLRVQLLANFNQAVSLVFSAPTLDILRHEHPNEFEIYLRPMFRQFHQEQTVFWMDDRIDWQVLADDFQPPSGLAARVSTVIAQLNSADFAQRQQAQKALRSLGEPAALFLHAADRRDWTPEQTARIDKFLAEYFVLGDDPAKKMGRDVNFLLDCLANDDPDIRAAALTRLDRVLGRKIEYKLDQPPADRTLAIEQLRRQWAPKPQNSAVSK